ncbi:MAG TPA: TonB-dependent receptor [Candidatus Avacidaminococcus intestinavium]|uniref:TonB-dependent receptor n=1 Tax=Candidatus Avacidaminococcus intestinavium TaxID=2840684 RepID=A0A9D1MNG6_9FIRM|nr:TonB-dependent receptor [Candidatus Avacidaminococcus intestinavium]
MQKRTLKMAVLLAVISGGLNCNLGYAEEQSPTFTLEEMVVTATRTMENIKKVPASVTVITSEQIRESNALTVTDVLKKSLGIFVNRPKGLADTSGEISMRGFSEDSVLVLYDGMPMNAAYDGGVNWSAIPMENIERIEIVRGAASSLYGGRAVGGVVNIISKEPDEKVRVKVNALYGSNNTWRRGLSVSQKVDDKFSYSVSYENRKTDGFKNKLTSSTSSGGDSPSGTVGTGVVISKKPDGKPRYIIGSPGDGAGESNVYNIKLKYNFTKDKNLTYSYTYDKFKYWTDNPVSYIHDAEGNVLYEGSVKLPNGKWYNFKESAFADYNGRRTMGVHALRYLDDDNKLTVNLGLSDIKDNGYSTSGGKFDGDTPGSDTAYPSKSYKFDVQKVWENIGKHTIVGGLNWQQDEMTRTETKLDRWKDKNSVSAVSSILGGKDKNFSAFVQDQYALDSQWKVYTGLRFDYYKKYNGYYNNIGQPIRYYDEADYTELSPKISLEYAQNDKTTWYLSYGHSFNPPTLYKLYRTVGTYYDTSYLGNPDLKPETTDTLEIGLKKRISKQTDLNFSLYFAKTDDLIALEEITVNGDSTKWYNNIDKARRKGIELELEHSFDKLWSGYLNYTFQDTEDNDGKRIYSIPKHIFHSGIGYKKDKLSGSLDFEYVSNRNKPNENSGVYFSYDGFFIANLGLNYAVNKEMKIGFNVLNLLDKDYYLWYAAPGRTYTLGVEYSF